jgi:hypothetical protein
MKGRLKYLTGRVSTVTFGKKVLRLLWKITGATERYRNPTAERYEKIWQVELVPDRVGTV